MNCLKVVSLLIVILLGVACETINAKTIELNNVIYAVTNDNKYKIAYANVDGGNVEAVLSSDPFFRVPDSLTLLLPVETGQLKRIIFSKSDKGLFIFNASGSEISMVDGCLFYFNDFKLHKLFINTLSEISIDTGSTFVPNLSILTLGAYFVQSMENSIIYKVSGDNLIKFVLAENPSKLLMANTTELIYLDAEDNLKTSRNNSNVLGRFFYFLHNQRYLVIKLSDNCAIFDSQKNVFLKGLFSIFLDKYGLATLRIRSKKGVEFDLENLVYFADEKYFIRCSKNYYLADFRSQSIKQISFNLPTDKIYREFVINNNLYISFRSYTLVYSILGKLQFRINLKHSNSNPDCDYFLDYMESNGNFYIFQNHIVLEKS